MPRQYQRGQTQRGVLDPISRPQATQVVARPTDQFELPPIDHELRGLVSGLQMLNPELQRYAQISNAVDFERDTKAGTAARQKGEELSKDSPHWFKHGYMMMDGQVKGDLDGKTILESYTTEFDKDSGDLDQFVREKFQGLTKGIQDESFLEGYNQTIAKHLQSVRQVHNEYQQGQVIQKVESNALQKMDNYLRPFAVNK